MQKQLSTAAFVPFDDTSLDERSTLAIRWILDREQETGRRAGLIVAWMQDYVEPIELFKRGRLCSSPRSSKSFGNGPVLVFCMGMEGLAKAVSCGREVAYVAWGNDPWMFGWAATVGAINLRSGQPEVPPSPEVTALLNDLDVAGRNGWYDNPGNEDARRILGLLGKQVSRDFTAGAMLARGHSVKSVKVLRALH